MGTVGDALDNDAVESFYATLQTELLDRYSWPTRSKLRSAIFEYIEAFYNRRRRHFSLEYLLPAEFEARWFNPELKAYYDSRRSQGKHSGVATGAVARRLLHLILFYLER